MKKNKVDIDTTKEWKIEYSDRQNNFEQAIPFLKEYSKGQAIFFATLFLFCCAGVAIGIIEVMRLS